MSLFILKLLFRRLMGHDIEFLVEFPPNRVQMKQLPRLVTFVSTPKSLCRQVTASAEQSRYRIVAGFVTKSSHVPLKTCRVGQRCTLNMSRAEKSFRWCGMAVMKEKSCSGVVHVT
ncbi:hypothetical protein TNCV_1303091 [Trichonephila clavipes]|nr:hypothetical protein TNCV_1303091 [Trichonephila clavipes]